jgi:hypothetical protein
MRQTVAPRPVQCSAVLYSLAVAAVSGRGAYTCANAVAEAANSCGVIRSTHDESWQFRGQRQQPFDTAADETCSSPAPVAAAICKSKLRRRRRKFASVTRVPKHMGVTNRGHRRRLANRWSGFSFMTCSRTDGRTDELGTANDG